MDFFFLCVNSKIVYPRYLRYFYYHGTMILPWIRQQETIRNWVTFCAPGFDHFVPVDCSEIVVKVAQPKSCKHNPDLGDDCFNFVNWT
jgi:hypothetical protein